MTMVTLDNTEIYQAFIDVKGQQELIYVSPIKSIVEKISDRLQKEHTDVLKVKNKTQDTPSEEDDEFYIDMRIIGNVPQDVTPIVKVHRDNLKMLSELDRVKCIKEELTQSYDDVEYNAHIQTILLDVLTHQEKALHKRDRQDTRLKQKDGIKHGDIFRQSNGLFYCIVFINENGNFNVLNYDTRTFKIFIQTMDMNILRDYKTLYTDENDISFLSHYEHGYHNEFDTHVGVNNEYHIKELKNIFDYYEDKKEIYNNKCDHQSKMTEVTVSLINKRIDRKEDNNEYTSN